MKRAVFILFCVICTSSAYAKTPNLFGVPTQFTTDSGVTFGAKGLYQYDLDDFSSDAIDPTTGMPLFKDANTWERKEFDLYAKWQNGFQIELGYDWQHSWTDNYVKYKSKSIGTFRVGQMLTQVGWEPNEGAQSWTFEAPALPVKAAYEKRRIGADWSYGGIKHVTLQVAYYWGGNLDGKYDGHTYSGRVVYAPIKSKTDVLHLGFAASREYPDNHIAQFSSPPEASLTKTALVDTKPLPFTDSIDRAGFELGALHDSFFLQGEYLAMTAHRELGLPEFQGHGFYLFGTWMLTGDTARTYKNTEFGLPKPIHDYGALGLSARYSQLDLRDGTVQGGHEHDWTIGLNWYWKNLAVQADYVWAHANDSPANLYVASIDPHVFELRAQIYFGP